MAVSAFNLSQKNIAKRQHKAKDAENVEGNFLLDYSLPFLF